MELAIIESFGNLNKKMKVLNSEEYAFLAGSCLVIKQFKSSGEKKNKFLRSESSHFSAFDFNPFLGVFAVCESGRNAIIKLFSYDIEKGFGEPLSKNQNSNLYKPLSEASVIKGLEVSILNLSRDCSRLVALFHEPSFQIKVYDINENLNLKLILTIPIEKEYTKCEISPTDKNFIFVMASQSASIIRITNSFPDDYITLINEDYIEKDFETLKLKEEGMLEKRYVMSDLLIPNSLDNYVDFVWDMYNNIYIALSSGEIYLYDINMTKILPIDEKECIKVHEGPTCLLMTQRYLLCAQENGKIAMANIWIPENEIGSFKTTIGPAESYNFFNVEREVTPSVFILDQSNFDSDYIIGMQYDPEMKNLIALTKMDSLIKVVLKAEILIKDKEKEEQSDSANQYPNEVNSWEENKYHTDKIIGIRELGLSSQFVTISEDKKIIIWELSSRAALSIHILDYVPSYFEIDNDGNILFVGSKESVIRIYDISSRSVLKLVHQSKHFSQNAFLSMGSFSEIKKIVIHPQMKYLAFYHKNENMVYFLSGEISKNFLFIGYVQTPGIILDIAVNKDYNAHGELLVLIKNFILGYKIDSFIYDHRGPIEIKHKIAPNLLSNFELKYDIKGRKVDGDLNIMIKHPTSDTIWLSGSDKYLRQYNMPHEPFETVKKSSKMENPVKEFKGHDLDIKYGIINNNSIITIGEDGIVQIRKDENEKVVKFARTHSFIRQGSNDVYFSQNRHLIYTTGIDGSIAIIAESDDFEIPLTENNLPINYILDNLDCLDYIPDSMVRSFSEIIKDEHNQLIKKTKKANQQIIKANLEEIKAELNKYISENSKLEEIEQLSLEDMIIDSNTIQKETLEGIEQANEMTRKNFKELCIREIKRSKLFEKTYNVMRNGSEQGGKPINNNIRLVSTLTGDRLLKSYPIRNADDFEITRINYVKQLRMIELHDKYKMRSENIKPTVEEFLFSRGDENYSVNRVAVKISLLEKEIRPQDVADINLADSNEKMNAEGGQYKAAKYKLQRHPYADEGLSKQEDNSDQINYKPDDQLLKEDLLVRFETIVDYAKTLTDLEWQRNLNEIETASILYSPFELYTNFRIRNQIYLLIDLIQNLKLTFNKEFKAFIVERNQSLEKFNTCKQAIEAIKEILVGLGTEVHVDDYSYTINPHEDNEWVEKVDENEIKVSRYFSKEEKMIKDEERRKELERLKALQGDTLEMRGLKTMIEHKSIKSKQTQGEDQELAKEPWMEKDKKEMTDDELRRYAEYMKKEKDNQEKKEKIRSQNWTKLSTHKMDIEAIKSEMELKFLKIVKKKLYYDYRITEQEMYILALIRTLEYRHEVRKKTLIAKENFSKATNDEIQAKKRLQDFMDNFEKFAEVYRLFKNTYEEKNGNNKQLDGFKKTLFDLEKELPQSDKEYLQKIRSDPCYFDIREKLKESKRTGNKSYKEFMIRGQDKKNQQENLLLINQKFYYEYKDEQIQSHSQYLEHSLNEVVNNKTERESEFSKLDKDFKKSKLNYDMIIRMKKCNDEITDENGPQAYIEETLLIDHTIIDNLNREINSAFSTKAHNADTASNHSQISQYKNLEITRNTLIKHEIDLKLRYLKLTRVTKKIQEIVTGREDIDQRQVALIYDQKKRNLDENKHTRLETMNSKLRELYNEIERKKKENSDFITKLQKLHDEVELKKQIIELDSEQINESEDNQTAKTKNKSLEIAQVTKLKNLVQQYYEEIEYLRSELDKLRAKTFPSFLQKPDQIIYPDEK